MNSPSDQIFTVVQLVLMNETGDSYYRMRWPAAELASQNPALRVINLDAGAEDRYRLALEADLLVLFQSADPDLLPILRRRSELGRKTLVEYNDNFYEPQAWSPVAKEWSSPLLWQIYEQFMRQADGVLVTGPGLKRLFQEVLPEQRIHILENHFPRQPAPLHEIFEKPEPRAAAIGWAGSLGHIADLLAAAPMIRRLCAENPRLTVHLMGNESIPAHVDLPAAQLRFTGWGSIEQYFSFWRPVQLGPVFLLDTPYNRCRSDIKAVEMAACGVLPVLPDALPYAEFVRSTGITPYRSLSELEDLLRGYIAEPERIERDLHRCYQYVCSSRIGVERRERAELYRRFLPAQPNRIEWGRGPGYHEVGGKQSTSTPSSDLLQQAQRMVSAKQFDEAERMLDRARKENPDNLDLVLSYIKLRRRSAPGEALALCDQYAQQFPRDLRFLMSGAALQSSRDAAAGKWNEIIGRYHALRPAGRLAFQTEITRALAALRAADVALFIGCADRLLAEDPNWAELQFMSAEALEKLGRYEEAAGRFSAVHQAQINHTKNAAFLSTASEGYLRAWVETLRARSGL